MPQLSKVRIVNFYYNDGNRLIADELFDFRDHGKKKANNVLVQLANGGGKSVLVQLMMQPVKPRATAAGRKIESFFIKPGYHSYVLLEWKKDKSAEKLLTGISMRSAMNSDTDRGKRIQYYTFISEYLNDYDSESIMSLELSSKSNGNFVPADYDYIKKISKNNNRITCYSQDGGKEWKDKLQEFYIFPNEWEMIEKINEVEGGLEMFFNQYTSSDNLIDKLLIPAIENEIQGETTDFSSDDKSLSTMFLNYADKHMKSANLIEKQKLYVSYIEQLNPFIQKFEELYTIEDKARLSERSMFGFADALVTYKQEQDDLKISLESDELQCRNKLYMIDHEEASADYYSSISEREKCEKNKNLVQQKADKIQSEIDSLDEKIKIQECADYYEKQKRAESEAKVIREKIAMIENGSDVAELINGLKYNVHVKAQNEIELLNQERFRLDKEIKENSDIRNTFSDKVQLLKSETGKLEKETIELEGSFKQLTKTTDSLISDYNFNLTRNILGLYETEDINLLEDNILNEKSDFQNRKTETEETIKKLSEQKDKIPHSIANINIKLADDKRSLKDINDKINEYDLKYEELCGICSEYGLNEKSIFNGYLNCDIESRISDKEAENLQLKNEIKVCERLLNAARNGCVHISREVIDYLYERKIEYITFEGYILTQIEDNKMESNKVSELLKQYPFLAYSLIIEDKEYDKLISYKDEIWFETAVPVFSMSEIGDMVSKSADSRKYIACYSSSLFENQNVFIQKTEEKKSNISERIDVLESELEHLNSQMKKIKAFDYTENWYSVQQENVNRLNEIIKESNDNINFLNNQKESLEKDINENNNLKEQLQSEINKAEEKIKALRNTRESILEENSKLEEINKSKKHYDETLKSYNEMNEKFNNAEVIIKSLSEALKATEDKLDFAQEAFNDTSSCNESEIINGSLIDLYAQYKEASSQQSSEIELQKSLLKSKNDIIQVYKKEINQRKLDVSLYESVIYNKQLKKASEHEIETAKKKFEKVSSELEICKENYNKAEIEYKNACEKLRNYGEPMPEVTIKPDFEDRRTRINNELEQLSSRIKAVSDLIVVIDRVTDRIKDAMDIVQRRETAVTVELEKDLHKQFEKLKSEWKENWREFNRLLKQSGEQLNYVIRDFQNDEYGLSQSLNNIYNLMNDKRGESIYSAKEMTDKYIDSAHKMSLKLKEDLSGIERDKKDLVHHCLLHAEQIHGGLLQLVKGSKITVYENKNPKNMLKIDIPEKFDRDSVEKYIDLEIEKSVDSFVNTDFASENKKRKEADKIVSSGRLLRTAIQKNNLTVRAFKVDQSADNASYRTWEESLVNNSGAEKFIVYLSIIVSIMNYSKSEASGIQNNSVYSTLILDNPFGSTTSPHILLPMFNLAEHFKVQMICLTHITQNDVVKCFDNVIKIFLKKMAMSSKEIIVQEKEADNETIAHGFYSVSEQLTIF